MAESNRSYRIHTTVGDNSNIMVQIDQDYDVLEILSIKMRDEDTYRLHSSNYGVIVGRVLANNGFGVPNAKISVFIEGDFNDELLGSVYPYQSTASKGGDGRRYNLLPDEQVDKYHKAVGSFPNKTYLLDNDVLIEVFDKYYKYTTRTNNSGDYLICGVPTGNRTIHMDLDISDCGVLSQRPRDFVYKGYTIEQFENPNQFKDGEDLDSLSQIFSQDQVVNVIPFWGDISESESIGITRADINIAFKFEPTCVFMGSVVADNASNGISKKCVPTNNMGSMDELTTGEGTIEMIRKTPFGEIEEFQVKGTQLIDGNGVWCYQIPMNLDYVMTDEYGNLVPTDDPEKGIPTRARVRFRVSMHDFEKNTDNYFRAKVLVPHNPQDLEVGHEGYDYEFGSDTREDSFRDLFWNNVYTVKSYIPRFQKSQRINNERFTGIKHCNIYGQNNPLPYNNIRIRLPLMFTIMCAMIKAYVWIIGILNYFQSAYASVMMWLADSGWLILSKDKRKEYIDKVKGMTLTTLYEGICPDLDWFFCPIAGKFTKKSPKKYAVETHSADMGGLFGWRATSLGNINLLIQTYNFLVGGEDGDQVDSTSIDKNSVDEQNRDEDESVCITVNTDYLISCIEMALAQEYKVINFDFYNDWINGVIYMPRWMRHIRPKMTFLFGLIKIKPKVKACIDDSSVFGKNRRYTQQCTLRYKKEPGKPYTEILNETGCVDDSNNDKQKCHKKGGWKQKQIFGSGKSGFRGNGGAVHEAETSKGQFVYYFKPCEWSLSTGKKTILFANDIVLLGSLNDCDQYGIPQAFKHLTSSTYIMPTNLALTNMDDDGSAYAGDDGTYCGKQGSEVVKEVNFFKQEKEFYSGDGEKLHPIENTFEATNHFYSTSSNEINYEGNDDTIPLTEAAGIAWNYTGPGQGKEEYNSRNRKLYLPGGHFLGISCVNAQTNIKSCINLQRICEAGVNMSQRREVVRNVGPNGEDYKLNYRYYVPTGFISHDEIVGGDFRTMFASMNHKRLLCSNNSINEDTGYPIYDFIYMKPNGFNGSFSKYSGQNTQYNEKVDNVDDESKFMQDKFKVELSDDYDASESGETYRRTVETVNTDYYMFRMGLNSLNAEAQNKRYIYEEDDGVALPQYENSFYFYFGLKDGATALDELNKQFFSEVESRSIVSNTPYISYDVEIDKCKLKGDLTLVGNFLATPIHVTIEDSKEGIKIVNNELMSGNTFKFNGIPFGSYTVTMTDISETTITKTIDVGIGVISIIGESYDFDFKTDGMSSTQIMNGAKNDDSGYLLLDKEVYMKESADSFVVGDNSSTENAFMIVNNNDLSYTIYPSVSGVDASSIAGKMLSGGSRTITSTVVGGSVKIFLWKPNCTYSVYFIHKCDGTWNGAYVKEYDVNGVDGFELYLGSKLLPYSTELKGKDLNALMRQTDVKGWAARHALFRQTDNDAASFTNTVFALNTMDRNSPTTLFGQPEKIDSLYYDGAKKIWNQYDGVFEGTLSDNSIIPTWGPIEKTLGREDFYEMGVNGKVVSTNSVGTFTVASSASGNNGLRNMTVNGVPISDGGCIVKLLDGTILYPVKSGNVYSYYGELVPAGTDVKIFETFKYPVMYRPFYSVMNFMVWDTIDMNQTGGGTYVDFSIDRVYGWRCDGSVYNGVTYNNRFSEFSINDENVIDSFIRNGSDLDGKDEYKPSETAKKIPIEESNGAVIKGLIEHPEMENSTPSCSFRIVEGCPAEVIDDSTHLANVPYFTALNEINGGIDGSFVNDIYCTESVPGMYMFLPDENESYEGEYYLLDKRKVTCPFDFSSPKVVCYCEGKDGEKYNGRSLRSMNAAYVSGRYNQVALDMSLNNDRSEDIYVKVENGLTWTKLTYSLYPNESATQKIEYSLFIAGTGDIDNLLTKAVTTVSGGTISPESTTVVNYLSKCGIDLNVTYPFKEGTGIVADDYIKQINDNVATKIEFDGSTVDLGNIDDYFAIGVITGTTGEKGIIRLFKLYPSVRKSFGWTSGGMKPMLSFEPADTWPAVDNGNRMFTEEGGDMTWRVKSNVEWKAKFQYEGNGKIDWLSFVNESNGVETVIRNGYELSGNGSVDYRVRASKNNGNDGKIGEINHNGEDGFVLHVSGSSDTIVETTDSATGEVKIGPLTAYTAFFLQGKQQRSYLNFNNSISDVYQFGNGGGSVDVKVTSNMGNWRVTLNGGVYNPPGYVGGMEWCTLQGGTKTATGNGDSFITIVTNKNYSDVGLGTNKDTYLEIDTYYGNEAKHEYRRVYIMMNAEPEKLKEPKILSIEYDVSENEGGSEKVEVERTPTGLVQPTAIAYDTVGAAGGVISPMRNASCHDIYNVKYSDGSTGQTTEPRTVGVTYEITSDSGFVRINNPTSPSTTITVDRNNTGSERRATITTECKYSTSTSSQLSTQLVQLSE